MPAPRRGVRGGAAALEALTGVTGVPVPAQIAVADADADAVERAQDNGVRAFAYTVDSPVTGRSRPPPRSPGGRPCGSWHSTGSGFGGSTIDVPTNDAWVMLWQPNPCQQEDASLARLVRFPEGVALLRAAAIPTRRRDSVGAPLRASAPRPMAHSLRCVATWTRLSPSCSSWRRPSRPGWKTSDRLARASASIAVRVGVSRGQRGDRGAPSAEPQQRRANRICVGASPSSVPVRWAPRSPATW